MIEFIIFMLILFAFSFIWTSIAALVLIWVGVLPGKEYLQIQLQKLIKWISQHGER